MYFFALKTTAAAFNGNVGIRLTSDAAAQKDPNPRLHRCETLQIRTVLSGWSMEKKIYKFKLYAKHTGQTGYLGF